MKSPSATSASSFPGAAHLLAHLHRKQRLGREDSEFEDVFHIRRQLIPRRRPDRSVVQHFDASVPEELPGQMQIEERGRVPAGCERPWGASCPNPARFPPVRPVSLARPRFPYPEGDRSCRRCRGCRSESCRRPGPVPEPPVQGVPAAPPGWAPNRACQPACELPRSVIRVQPDLCTPRERQWWKELRQPVCGLRAWAT